MCIRDRVSTQSTGNPPSTNMTDVHCNYESFGADPIFELMDLLAGPSLPSPRPSSEGDSRAMFTANIDLMADLYPPPMSSPEDTDDFGFEAGGAQIERDQEQTRESSDESSHVAPCTTLSKPKRRRKGTVTEVRDRKNRAEKRRIHEIGEIVEQLRQEIKSHDAELECGSKLSCLNSALALIQRSDHKKVTERRVRAKRSPALSGGNIDHSMLFENDRCACAVLNPTGTFVAMNRAFRQMCGYVAEDSDTPMPTLMKLTIPEELPKMMGAMSQLMAGEVSRIKLEKTCKSLTGDLFRVEVDLSVVFNQGDQPIAFNVTAMPLA
eukprot:TRINITY_DN3831_c0_g1_i1.p1 TRINITY_DN3831_c0_g1~~TRINITY_DN3831_c0_g1_i1.p1  ORF type:complete len:323 (+),score=83.77 TRINITY_DN3831_c0_g1_i1:114-1082(+)